MCIYDSVIVDDESALQPICGRKYGVLVYIKVDHSYLDFYTAGAVLVTTNKPEHVGIEIEN